MHKILWSPDKSFIEQSNLKSFENWLLKHRNLQFQDYRAIWQWSIDNLDDFWESIIEFFDVNLEGQYDKVRSQDQMPGVKWFEGSKVSYSEHLFKFYKPKQTALIEINESGQTEILWSDLKEAVTKLQHTLKELGVKKGDRVCAMLSNSSEAIISFIAVNSLGAIWSCCSPDFGVNTIIERFSQIEPKILITTSGYTYKSKFYDKSDTITDLISSLTSLENVITIGSYNPNSSNIPSISWTEIMKDDVTQELEFLKVPFNHPIWVLYSSGTTGKPKAITHSNGGILLEHLKYMSLHNDAKEGENFFWFSTTGWMMWNFLQASMLVGAIPVLYDGSPNYPDLEVLWKIADQLPIHHFGTSAPYLTACMKAGLDLNSKFQFKQLRSIGSTGAPLPPEVFEWIYSKISSEVWLCSMSGGTDVCTAFVGSVPYFDVIKGLIQGRALGCALMSYDSQGKSINDRLGEMVIEKPMPSMPIYFWNDNDNKRYISSYFEDFENKWRHGDWIKIFENQSLIIQGRSDSTLNRKGVRIGTAEIYNSLDNLSFIKDALVINVDSTKGDDEMIMFVVLENNINLDDRVIQKIKAQLKADCSPRHIPDRFHKIDDIPYTLSGKKMEVPVKKLFMNYEIESVNEDAIRNPQAMVALKMIASDYKNLN